MIEYLRLEDVLALIVDLKVGPIRNFGRSTRPCTDRGKLSESVGGHQCGAARSAAFLSPVRPMSVGAMALVCRAELVPSL